MKLKKISSICTKSKTYVLFDKPDAEGNITQWLGDSSAAYQLSGLPVLDEDSLCKLFDIPEKRRGNFHIRRTDMEMDVSDTSPSDRLIEGMGLSLTYKSLELLPLKTQTGILFIQQGYLAPLEDEAELIELYERRSAKDNPYIVAKAGLFIRAIIMPVEILQDDFMDRLEDVFRECRAVMVKKAQDKAAEEGHNQLSWTEEQEDDK